MEQAIYGLLANTLNPDPAVRTAAEKQLRENSTVPGFCSSLLQILTIPTVEPHVKQSAAIYFKNLIKYWRPFVEGESTDRFTLSEHDRTVVRSVIVEAALQSPPRLRAQLLFAVGIIIQHDYPEKWPELLGKVVMFLSSPDPSVVHGGLLILLELVRRFEYAGIGKRAELDNITQQTFPVLLHYYKTCVTLDTREAGEIMYLINKIFFTAVQHDISIPLRDALSEWVPALLSLVAKPVPAQAEDANSDPWERAHGPWWRAKKWCHHTLHRLCSRYGNPTLAPDHHRAFAKSFLKSTTPVILQALLAEMNEVIEGRYVAPRLVQITLEFSSDCIDHAVTWALLKNNMRPLLVDLCFPLLCHTDADQEMWESDPHEYLRAKFDAQEEYRSPVAAAMNFVHRMVSMRKKSTLMVVLQFCHSILSSYAAAAPAERNYRHKDGALAMIGAASTTIEESEWLIPQMEELINTHVLSEIECPAPFLRARALWVLGQFGSLNFEHEQTIVRALDMVIRGMRDPELPVKVQAAIALSFLLEKPFFQEHIRPSLQIVMQELLALTQESSVEHVTQVMSNIVETFADDMAPFAVQLCTQMRDTFLGMLEEELSRSGLGAPAGGLAAMMDDDDDDDEFGGLGLTIMGILRTMLTVIRAVDDHPQVLLQLEPVFYPLMSHVLQNANFDMLEEILEMVVAFTYIHGRPISDMMWSVLPMLYQAYKMSAFDYFTEMVPAIDNYISVDSDAFMADPSRLQMVLEMIEGVMTSTRAGDIERSNACKLIEAVMMRLRGRIDHVVPTLIDMALPAAGRASEDALIVCGLEVAINALLYNSTLALSHLESKGWTDMFLGAWSANADRFVRVHDKKLSIIALCQLWRTPSEQLPASAQNFLPASVAMMAKFLQTMPAAVLRRAYLENRMMQQVDDDDDDEVEEDDEGNAIGDEDDIFNEKDAQYLEQLTRRAGRAARREGAVPSGPDDEDDAAEMDAFEDDDEDEDDEDGENGFGSFPTGLEEEFFVELPIDETDEYIVFQETMDELQRAGGQRIALLSSALDADMQRVFAEAGKLAQKKREDEAAAPQKDKKQK